MPTQLSDIYVEDGTTFTYEIEGETWIVDKGVKVGSGDGHAFYSAYVDSTLINSGLVYSDTNHAVRMVEGGTKIVNEKSGEIEGELSGIMLGQAEGKTLAKIVNKGKITATGEGSAGVHIYNFENVKIKNEKKIKSENIGVHIRSDVDDLVKGAKVTNEKKIIGGDIGVRISYTSDVKTKIKNDDGGLIKGAEYAIISANGALKVVNKGKIKGDIQSNDDSAADKVVNKGKIKGDVILGEGDDVYKNKGGTAELVYGRQGNDLLIAGESVDQFVFDRVLDAATNVDTIEGFETGVDKLLLDMSIFKSLTDVGALAQGNFVEGDAAVDSDDFIIYDPDTGAIYYDKSGAGGSDPVQFARVEPGLDMSHSDFVVIA